MIHSGAVVSAALAMTTEIPHALVRRIQRLKLGKAIGYRAHASQQRLHDAIDHGARRVMVTAGRRGGKSQFGAIEICAELSFGPVGHLPVRSCLIAAPESDITDNVFGLCWKWIVDEQIFGCAPVAKSARQRYIEMPWRARLEGKTTKDPTSLRGPGRSITVADEFAFGNDVLKDYLIPPLIDCDGLFIAITTPDGDNFAKDYYDDWTARMNGEVEGVNPALYCTHTWTSWDNPYLPRHVLEEIKAMYLATGSVEIYEQEILAKFTAMAGAIYPMFSKTRHVSPIEFIPGLPVILGVDFGFTNPACVLFGQRQGEQIRVFDEIYQSGLTDQRLAEMVKDRLNEWGVNIEDDSQYDICYSDPEHASGRAEFDEQGIYTTIGAADGSRINAVKQGIAAVRRQLSVPEPNPPGIVIHPRCSNLIRTLPKYAISPSNNDRDPRDDEPKKKEDHAPDSLRYLVFGEFGQDTWSFNALTAELDKDAVVV